MSVNLINAVYLRINDCCNFNCEYCFKHLKKSEKHQMKLSTLNDAIEFMKEHLPHIKAVSIPQREPLYNPILFRKIVKTLNSNGYRVTNITTNLFNLTNKVAKVLKENNTFVLTSYDGIWQYRRRHANGDDTSQTVLHNIMKLKNRGIRYHTATVVSGHLVHELFLNYLHLREVTPFIALNLDYNTFCCKSLRTLKQQLIKIHNHDPDYFFNKIFPVNKTYDSIVNNKVHTNKMCGAGRGGITINWDGILYPCYHGDAWEQLSSRIPVRLGSIYEGIRYDIMEKYRHYSPKCPYPNCFVRICGSCYLYNYDTTKDPFIPGIRRCNVLRLLYITLHQLIGGK